MELGTQQAHDYQWRTSTWHIERPGRSKIKALPRYHRLENQPHLFQACMKIQGPCQKNLFVNCLKHSTPDIFQLETRSPKPLFRYLSPELAPGEKLRFPMNLLNNENIDEDSVGRRTCFDYSSLASTGLVPCTPRHVGGFTNPVSSISHLLSNL